MKKYFIIKKNYMNNYNLFIILYKKINFLKNNAIIIIFTTSFFNLIIMI